MAGPRPNTRTWIVLSVVAAGLVAFGLHVVHIGAREFAWFNIGLVIVWILLNAGIAREHRKLVPEDRGAAAGP